MGHLYGVYVSALNGDPHSTVCGNIGADIFCFQKPQKTKTDGTLRIGLFIYESREQSEEGVEPK